MVVGGEGGEEPLRTLSASFSNSYNTILPLIRLALFQKNQPRRVGEKVMHALSPNSRTVEAKNTKVINV